jgi:hypothetical protein
MSISLWVIKSVIYCKDTDRRMRKTLNQWFQPRSRTDVAVGLVAGFWMVWLLITYWTGGINWSSPSVVAWVGTVTAVVVGVLIGAFGIATGDYYRRRETYLTGMKVFGAVALITFIGAVVAG